MGAGGSAGAAPAFVFAPSCTIAVRLSSTTTVPTRIILRTRWAARELSSASRVAPAPRSGSKRFRLTITSVPIDASTGTAVFSLAADAASVSEGAGRSQGTFFQVAYTFHAAKPAARARITLNSDDRVKIGLHPSRPRTRVPRIHLGPQRGSKEYFGQPFTRRFIGDGSGPRRPVTPADRRPARPSLLLWPG